MDIKPSITALAEALKATFTLGEGGIVTVAPGAYESTLPESLTPEVVRQVQDHNADVLAAAALALGQVAIEGFVKDKALDQVVVNFPCLADTMGGNVLRSKSYAAGGIPKEGEKRDPNATVEKFGVITMGHIVAANANRGTLKKVRSHINALAAEALNK